jgi:hypothetical protein
MFCAGSGSIPGLLGPGSCAPTAGGLPSSCPWESDPQHGLLERSLPPSRSLSRGCRHTHTHTPQTLEDLFPSLHLTQARQVAQLQGPQGGAAEKFDLAVATQLQQLQALQSAHLSWQRGFHMTHESTLQYSVRSLGGR